MKKQNDAYETGAEVFSRLNRELTATEYSESVHKKMKKRAYARIIITGSLVAAVIISTAAFKVHAATANNKAIVPTGGWNLTREVCTVFNADGSVKSYITPSALGTGGSSVYREIAYADPEDDLFIDENGEGWEDLSASDELPDTVVTLVIDSKGTPSPDDDEVLDMY